MHTHGCPQLDSQSRRVNETGSACLGSLSFGWLPFVPSVAPAQVSCAAVARSWGEKLAYATGQHWVAGGDTFGQLSVAAGAAPAACALLLMYGLRLGKNTISFFTVVKVRRRVFDRPGGVWGLTALRPW